MADAKSSAPSDAQVPQPDDLQFQSFAHQTSAVEGSIQPASGPILQPDASFQDTDRLLGTQPQEDAKFYQLAFYKPYFDVDTIAVGKRLLWSLAPFRTSFLESIQLKPDLYGPFWISTTLIFLMAALSNFASWIVFAPTDDKLTWQYDFTRVTFATATIYCYVTLMPLIIYLALNHNDAPVGFVQVACVYGYAMMPFVPAQVVCIAPSEIARWIAVGLAGLLSGAFIALSLWGVIRVFLQKRGLLMGGFMLLTHAALIVVIKFFFFNFAV